MLKDQIQQLQCTFVSVTGQVSKMAEGSHGAKETVLTPFAFCRVGTEPKRGPCPAGEHQHPQHHSRDSVATSDSEKVISQLFTHTFSCSYEGLISGHYKQQWTPEKPRDLPVGVASLPSWTAAPDGPWLHVISSLGCCNSTEAWSTQGFPASVVCREGTHLPGVGMNPRNRDGPN